MGPKCFSWKYIMEEQYIIPPVLICDNPAIVELIVGLFYFACICNSVYWKKQNFNSRHHFSHGAWNLSICASDFCNFQNCCLFDILIFTMKCWFYIWSSKHLYKTVAIKMTLSLWHFSDNTKTLKIISSEKSWLYL